MIKVGLTGNIGSGKSTVARIFEILGVPVYRADDAGRKFLEEESVVRELESTFGKEILEDATTIDRKKLANLVFNDPEALETLNGIIHPRVRQDLNSWMETQKAHPYIIQEAAILFESGFNEAFDAIIFIRCPKEVAIQRVTRRDSTTRETVLVRMQNQWPEDKKIPLSDYVITNDGKQLVIPQVLAIHEKLRGD
jgi:dephospho-CoA kinase